MIQFEMCIRIRGVATGYRVTKGACLFIYRCGCTIVRSSGVYRRREWACESARIDAVKIVRVYPMMYTVKRVCKLVVRPAVRNVTLSDLPRLFNILNSMLLAHGARGGWAWRIGPFTQL